MTGVEIILSLIGVAIYMIAYAVLCPPNTSQEI